MYLMKDSLNSSYKVNSVHMIYNLCSNPHPVDGPFKGTTTRTIVFSNRPLRQLSLILQSLVYMKPLIPNRYT